jgi:hypothetical protein
MNVKRFYAVGRAVFAETEKGSHVLFAVTEFNNSEDSDNNLSYQEALHTAEFIVDALTNYTAKDLE